MRKDTYHVLGVFRQVLQRCAVVVLLREGEDFLDVQVLVLGHVQVGRLLAGNAQGISVHQIPQKPDCYLGVLWEIALDLRRQKVVDLEKE